MTPRIVSLLPAATEIVCALGFRDFLVGRSHECDFPSGVETVPACTRARVDSGKDGAAIHENVEALLRRAMSLYETDAALLRELHPTHVVTQIQCRVCAVSVEDVQVALAEWTEGSPPVLAALEASTLEGILDDFRRVARALGAEERGEALAAETRARMWAVAGRTQAISEKPRAACMEWLSPLMSAGNWIPELVDLAGGVNLFGEAGRHSPWLSWEALAAADPDVLLIFPCGFSLERGRSEIHVLTDNPRWRELRAVREGRVHLADGSAFFNRPGPRVAQTLEIMAEIFHPAAFNFGYEGKGWARLV